jgi:tRNA pseudouridine32 synthase/23S rRNA pseudouridine746 synthase
MDTPLNRYYPPPDNGLDVIYEDEALLVVDKPSGLLSVPGRGAEKQDSLLSRIRRHWPQAECVHRLDMETSGVMVMALGKAPQRTLNRLFQQRRVKKGYIAVVDGNINEQYGDIDLPLICDWPNRPRQKVDFRSGKPSHTRFSVLGYNRSSDTTRLALQPATGRSHQLRVHLQALGHCILGDSLYASPQARNKASRLLLHAAEISFEHPLNGRLSRFSARIPF